MKRKFQFKILDLRGEKVDSRSSTLNWLACLSVLFSPHIFLDYAYEYETEFYIIPFAKYLFFFFTVGGGLILARHICFTQIKNLVTDRKIQVLFGGLLVGSLVSFSSFGNLKTLTIWMSISASCVTLAVWIFHNNTQNKWLVLLILLAPFFFTVLTANILEFFGPIDVGVLLENQKHKEFTIPRWRHLHNAANGFGFDSAIATIFCFILLHSLRSPSQRIFVVFLFLLSGSALIFSGTRAAFLLTIASMVFFAINYYSMTNLFRAAIAVTVAAIIVSISVGQENLYSLLRISKSWDSITTGRFSSMIEMLHLISSSPLKGHGFGSLDSEVIVYPNNLFYFGIPLEIGIVGAAGVFGLFLYPHYLLFRHVGISRRRHFFRSLDLFDRWALTILFGLPFWLMGEFEVFRVSACNQLYVLVWALVMFRIKETLSKN